MNKELVDSFKKLPLNIKRDKLYNEIITIDNILNFLLNSYNISYSNNVKNYNINDDSLKNESEFLDFSYEDVYLIEQKLLTIVQLLSTNKNNK